MKTCAGSMPKYGHIRNGTDLLIYRVCKNVDYRYIGIIIVMQSILW